MNELRVNPELKIETFKCLNYSLIIITTLIISTMNIIRYLPGLPPVFTHRYNQHHLAFSVKLQSTQESEHFPLMWSKFGDKLDLWKQSFHISNPIQSFQRLCKSITTEFVWCLLLSAVQKKTTTYKWSFQWW